GQPEDPGELGGGGHGHGVRRGGWIAAARPVLRGQSFSRRHEVSVTARPRPGCPGGVVGHARRRVPGRGVRAFPDATTHSARMPAVCGPFWAWVTANSTA